MSHPPPPVRPDLATLFGLFPDQSDRPAYTPVPGDRVPEPYRGLLVHNHHMTVTVEAFYNSPVDVRILDRHVEGDDYARKILLTLRATGQVVQFGAVRIRLDLCSQPVREAIVAGRTPLGRILIQNNVLRRIEPTAFLHVEPGPGTERWFGPELGRLPTYGRLGVIFTDNRPAIEVLEIVAPVAPIDG
jgi:chorismate-pyruvate lyase